MIAKIGTLCALRNGATELVAKSSLRGKLNMEETLISLAVALAGALAIVVSFELYLAF